MPASAFSFQLQTSKSRIVNRVAVRLPLRTATVNLPAFMPVGTLGTVKGLLVEQLQRSGVGDGSCKRISL